MRAAALVFLALVADVRPARADEVDVAVAANFAGAMDRIADSFQKDTGHRVVVTPGATGTLFAQIENGAPFDVLFAADQETPRKLEGDGFAVPGTRFTYALGRLALWIVNTGDAGAGTYWSDDAAEALLRRGDFRHLAIANPKIAPYGAAGIAVLAALKILAAVRPKLVQGESVAQTYQFVASGNAELGFVALSQLRERPGFAHDGLGPMPVIQGSYWVVPLDLYPPLRQDAVLLRRGEKKPAAASLCEYLRKTKIRDVIRAYGYGMTP